MSTPTEQPSLRPGVGAAVDSAGRLRMIRFASSTHLVYDVEPHVPDLVALLDGSRSTADLLRAVRAAHPHVAAQDVENVLDVLHAEGLLDGIPARGSCGLAPHERHVYRRQLDFLADFAPAHGHQDDLLAALRDARVLVLGLGGTGSWVAQSLALCGVGGLRLVDPDVVDPSNLSRQVLYTRHDVGAAKADVAQARLTHQLGDLCSVEAVSRHLTGPADLADLVAGCDLVVNCADEPDINTTSAWVAHVCAPLRIPHLVGGGYDGHSGMLGLTIVPGRTTCWACIQRDHRKRWPPEQLRYLPPSRRRHRGAFAPLAAVITNIQVWDAIRVLTGIAPPILANRVGELDFADLSVTWHDVPPDPDCPRCEGTS